MNRRPSKLSKGLSKFTVDLSAIGAILCLDYIPYQQKNAIRITSKSGDVLCCVDYMSSTDRDSDYTKLLNQWEAYLEDADYERST